MQRTAEHRTLSVAWALVKPNTARRLMIRFRFADRMCSSAESHNRVRSLIRRWQPLWGRVGIRFVRTRSLSLGVNRHQTTANALHNYNGYMNIVSTIRNTGLCFLQMIDVQGKLHPHFLRIQNACKSLTYSFQLLIFKLELADSIRFHPNWTKLSIVDLYVQYNGITHVARCVRDKTIILGRGRQIYNPFRQHYPAENCENFANNRTEHIHPNSTTRTVRNIRTLECNKRSAHTNTHSHVNTVAVVVSTCAFACACMCGYWKCAQ